MYHVRRSNYIRKSLKYRLFEQFTLRRRPTTTTYYLVTCLFFYNYFQGNILLCGKKYFKIFSYYLSAYIEFSWMITVTSRRNKTQCAYIRKIQQRAQKLTIRIFTIYTRITIILKSTRTTYSVLMVSK